MARPRSVHDPCGLLAIQQNGSTWTWGVLDALGSQRAQVSGGLVAARHFSEYGVVQGQHGTFSNPMAFTGEPLDANGLQYHRARYYAPTLGIFPSLDPFEGISNRPMSLNGYSWVEGNPVMNVDPSGMTPGCDCMCAEHGDKRFLACLEECLSTGGYTVDGTRFFLYGLAGTSEQKVTVWRDRAF